jgi:hypothetical protein
MLIPNFEFLLLEQENGQLYKGFHREEADARFCETVYYVFSEESPEDGMVLFSPKNEMSKPVAEKLIDRLNSEGKACWIYSRSIPRLGCVLDPNSPRWAGIEFAPAYEEVDC